MTTLTATEKARTRMKFARFGLTGHNCADEDSAPPGRWEPAACGEYRLHGTADVVLSSFTNMHWSDLGAPGIFTEWGDADHVPVWATFKEPDGSQCWHLRYVHDPRHICEVRP